MDQTELLTLLLSELKKITEELRRLNEQTRMLVYREVPKSETH
jgi:hypothetical protein